MRRNPFTALAAATLLAACSTSPATMSTSPLQDGQVPVPAHYRSWPKFLSDVQRADVKQVRDIYVNATGSKVQAGQPYADGTVFVMENYSAQTDASGQPVKGADGKLVKGNLLRVFVMGKGRGFGNAAEVRNGEWAYGAYDATGAKTADNFATCRTCHAPLASKDFVFGTEQYLAMRAKGG